MKRMTVRQDDIIYFNKDGELLPPTLMSSFDIRTALMKLADYEDKEEETIEKLTTKYKQEVYNAVNDYVYIINRNNGVSDIYPDIKFNEDGGFELKFNRNDSTHE